MKNKRMIVTIVLSITLVLTFTLLTSYAYWRVSKTQTGTNKIEGACLSIELEEDVDENDNKIEGFTLENAWPITDEEGLSQSGYQFKVINKCEGTVTYQIVLDSLEPGNNMNPKYVKVQLDNGWIYRYNSLEDATTEELEDNMIASKGIYTGTLPKKVENTNGEVEHTIKLWISEDSPNDEIGKVFNSKVRVIAGQGLSTPEYAITPESCFVFDESTGTITGYHEGECTTDYLVLPANINGIMIKKIGDAAFYNINFYYLDLTKATGLETIGSSAFDGFGGGYYGVGKSLKIPDSVKNIESRAFEVFHGQNLILGNSIETIGDAAFEWYGSDIYPGEVGELIIPNSVTTIGEDAFASYSGPKIVLGDSIRTIKGCAFASYAGTNQELVIPDSVYSIGYGAFAGFNGTNLVLSNNLSSIGGYSFHNYVGENTSLTIPGTLSTIADLAFYNYKGTNGNLIIEEGVSRIFSQAFYNYVGNEFTLPSTINTLSSKVFNSYVGLINLEMTESRYNSFIKNDNWKNESATLHFNG